jgi:hypothetical protein
MSNLTSQPDENIIPASDDNGRKGHPEGAWAMRVDKLEVSYTPPGVTAINVQGHQAIGALQGFGSLWKKTYRIRLSDIPLTAEQVMQVWKENFPKFQPPGNLFYPPLEGVVPGKVMLIDSPLPIIPPRYDKPGVVPMTSGVMILYSDAESFSVMTPLGFPVAGWNTFSVFEEEDSLTAQVQSFERGSDPIYEFGFRFMGGANRQEYIWVYVLTHLAEHIGFPGTVSIERECLDPKLQWHYARNIWHNAGVRTTLYKIAAPARWVRDLFR